MPASYQDWSTSILQTLDTLTPFSPIKPSQVGSAIQAGQRGGVGAAAKSFGQSALGNIVPSGIQDMARVAGGYYGNKMQGNQLFAGMENIPEQSMGQVAANTAMLGAAMIPGVGNMIGKGMGAVGKGIGAAVEGGGVRNIGPWTTDIQASLNTMGGETAEPIVARGGRVEGAALEALRAKNAAEVLPGQVARANTPASAPVSAPASQLINQTPTPIYRDKLAANLARQEAQAAKDFPKKVLTKAVGTGLVGAVAYGAYRGIKSLVYDAPEFVTSTTEEQAKKAGVYP